MLASISVYDMERSLAPIPLDSLQGGEILGLLIAAQELRKDIALEVTLGRRARPMDEGAVNFTITFDDGRYYAVEVLFL